MVFRDGRKIMAELRAMGRNGLCRFRLSLRLAGHSRRRALGLGRMMPQTAQRSVMRRATLRKLAHVLTHNADHRAQRLDDLLLWNWRNEKRMLSQAPTSLSASCPRCASSPRFGPARRAIRSSPPVKGPQRTMPLRVGQEVQALLRPRLILRPPCGARQMVAFHVEPFRR